MILVHGKSAAYRRLAIVQRKSVARSQSHDLTSQTLVPNLHVMKRPEFHWSFFSKDRFFQPTIPQHASRADNRFLRRRRGVGVLFLAASLLVLGRRELPAQDIVRVYSAEGPAPAIHEAAAAFFTNQAVKVSDGPPSAWLGRATADADVVCSSADFMMSAFISNEALQVDPSTVTPLYMRPSAILVRPGNPKRVEDFPDLLRPGLRVMVVSGSGQTGLWEDMASRKADVQTVHALRKNIVLYAANSTEAVKTWRERKDVDAWITWDTWHIPLRTEAKLIPVSKEYRVYRQCSVALTSRGRDKPEAVRFVKFLASTQGAQVFASWGWLTTPAVENTFTVRQDIAVVCGVNQNISTNGVGLGLLQVKQLVESYESAGVAHHNLHISVVLYGQAASWLLKDAPYRTFTGKEEGNPNKALVEKLLDWGVSVELCGMTLKEHGWSKDDVLPRVTIVAGGYQQIVDLQLRGYAYLPL